MAEYLWIGLGGALGSVGRFWLGGLISGRWGAHFPWGTLLVNVSGCFIIGLFAALTGPGGREATTNVRGFFMIGVCGGYTTFSSFALQTLQLAEQGQMARAAWNTAGSVVLCLLAVWLGQLAGLSLNSARR